MSRVSLVEEIIEHQLEAELDNGPVTARRSGFRDLRERIPSQEGGRNRRIAGDELRKLELASKRCSGLNRYYVPLAICLGIETGMQLQEMFDLTWPDIELDQRRIYVPDRRANRFEGRTIVLPYCPSFLDGT